MDSRTSATQRFLERAEAFRFDPASARATRLDASTLALRQALPRPPQALADMDLAALQRHLTARELAFRKGAKDLHSAELKALLAENLRSTHAYTILHGRTHLVDAIHRHALSAALEDLPFLLRLRLLDREKELAFKSGQVPRKAEKLEGFLASLPAVLEAEGDSPQARAYYAKVEDLLRRELAATEADVNALTAELPALRDFAGDADAWLERLVIFARGGYGRCELSFNSDLDTGYCIDTQGLNAGQGALLRELVVRMEGLLQDSGVDTAHQFFELDEDLSRFTEPETLHTLPALLEARAVAGNPTVLHALQGRVRELLPFEAFVRRKQYEYAEQPRPGLTEMDVKADLGGLRTIQVPLWIAGVVHQAQDFSSAGLLKLLVDRELLLPWEAARLLAALELLNDLRNFSAGARGPYYDAEAQSNALPRPDGKADRVNDAVLRLYVYRKRRFPTVDACDTYRLRLQEETQAISARLLEQVLDLHIEHALRGFRVRVHLGRRQVTDILPPSAAPLQTAFLLHLPAPEEAALLEGGAPEGAEAPGDAAALLQEPVVLLELMAYLAETDYALHHGVREALSGLVTRQHIPRGGEALQAITAQFSRIFSAPFTHRALQALFAINDSFSERTETLLGAYIPAFEDAIYLLRRTNGEQVPLHQHLVRCVEAGQVGLDWLEGRYPELWQVLQPQHVLALKWSLLLHGLGRLPQQNGGGMLDAATTAEQGASVLVDLGYEPGPLEQSVRLLIEHHGTLTALCKMATYVDQAMARFFELAARQTENAVLLFLVNRAVLTAQGGRALADSRALEGFFDEANRILAEARGFPAQDESLELINRYLYHKKEELKTETRLHMVLHRTLALGVRRALLEPLAAAHPDLAERLREKAGELEAMQKRAVLGGQQGREAARLEERLGHELRRLLPERGVQGLLAEQEELFQWFFASFPNRYLMGSTASALASQLQKFATFRTAQVIVDLAGSPQDGSQGLLIYTRQVPRSHTRVAYALSRKRLNLRSGKVNRVKLGPDEYAFCYYFEISPLSRGEQLQPSDLELQILNEMPPRLSFPAPTRHRAARGTRVDFLEDDGKGYRVACGDGQCGREPAPFKRVRVTVRDEPFLFYKIAQCFDLFQVEPHQMLVTTTGNQVLDYFYLEPEDQERLAATNFEEAFVVLVGSDLLELAG